MALLLFGVRPHFRRDAMAQEQTLPRRSVLSVEDISGEAKLVLGPNTGASFQKSLGDEIDLRITEGTVLAHVLPRSSTARFLIRTPEFVARVTGTVLRVSVAADGSSAIAVGHGSVEVRSREGRRVLVSAGQCWPKSAPIGPSPEELELLGNEDREGVTPESFAPSSLDCVGNANERLACELAIGERGSPLAAESALYAAGWIELHDLDDPERALATWNEERRRFKSGTL